ncbi:MULTISPECIES: hypothetical protein [unclassified Bosea (in: a-proteobacteria)]|nr:MULTISPECIES: hypothetical protein [unclassified Bosea (in: a-proteobacteria)]
MTPWEAFALGCIVTIAGSLMIRAAVWVARSRPLADAMEGEHGDQPHLGG